METNNDSKTLKLHASQVRADLVDQVYEFTLDSDLSLVECGKVISLSRGLIAMYRDFESLLSGKLFELNHVRVDMTQDNRELLDCFVARLSAVGVGIQNRPGSDMMSYCYQPAGRLLDVVRFYYEPREQKLIFLSHAVQLKLVSVNAQ